MTVIDRQQIEIHSLADLQKAVRDAAAARASLADYGVAHAGVGRPPAANSRLIVWGQAGSGILEHHRDDFTVRIWAGATFASAQAALAEAGQFLPIDADPDMTLGEIVNQHVFGPLRVSFGSVRDHLLGLEYVDGQGRTIRVGGRTVKNVAGYDVTRLMVGAMGELGMIHAVTLRTYALPQEATNVEVVVDKPESLEAILTSWLVGPASPTWMSAMQGDRQWRLRLGYFGPDQACDAQTDALETFLANAPGLTIAKVKRISFEEDADHRQRLRSWRREQPVLLKLILPPASIGIILEALLPGRSGARPDVKADALPLHGCVFIGGKLDDPLAHDLVPKPGDPLDLLGALHVWYSRPASLAHLPPAGPPQPDWDMFRKLKQVMDPAGVFNPGRLIPMEDGAS